MGFFIYSDIIMGKYIVHLNGNKGRNMKKILFICIMMACALGLSARPNDCMIVHMKDGSYAVFLMEKSPRITFEGQVVTVSDEHWQISNVRKYTIGDSETTGIMNVGKSKGINGYSVNEGQITVRLADKAQKVRLYTLSGMELPLGGKTDANGVLRLSLPKTGDEVFLLNIGNETLKIRRP